jgi:hypothetical protein
MDRMNSPAVDASGFLWFGVALVCKSKFTSLLTLAL